MNSFQICKLFLAKILFLIVGFHTIFPYIFEIYLYDFWDTKNKFNDYLWIFSSLHGFKCLTPKLQPSWLFVLFHIGLENPAVLVRYRSPTINFFWFILYSELPSTIIVFLQNTKLLHSKMTHVASSLQHAITCRCCGHASLLFQLSFSVVFC